MVKRIGPLLVLILFLGKQGFTQDLFARGEELFMLNKPAEALPFLEGAIGEDPDNVRAFLYLGVVYLQLEKPDDAIAVYRDILPRAGEERARVAFNMGNAYFSKGNADSAEQFYTRAIETDSAYGPAYLNRANTRLQRGALQEAIADYEQYLALEPDSPKRPSIEQLTALIRAEFAAEERRRILAEEEAAAEAERRQRLLEEVSASLRTSAEESQGLSAGAEDVLNYEGEFELE
ncbi:MAG: tetratricopeptide repeat protein [Spirochaetaceae bacterium]|jgi:tetratricopeptide (TPR) repeat protein|nr:tetratricopeptide repeat protein [Spirochaetaceae bacterium]